MKAKKKRKRTSFLKIRLLPWYWKIVLSVVWFFCGGILGSQLFTSASDLALMTGFAVLVICLWVLIQI